MQHSDTSTVAPQTPPRAAPSSASPRLRVLVVGVSWPMETFVERLLTGLARSGMDLTLAPMSSLARPGREWMERHRIRWVDDAVPRSPRAVARVATGRGQGSLVQAIRPTRLVRSNRASRKRLVSEPWDVIYAPWINVLVDHPDLLGLGTPLVTSCRGTLITIAPWDPSMEGFRLALSEVFAGSTLVHCVAEAIVSDAVDLGLDPHLARVIRPAVDPDAFTPRSASRKFKPLRVIGVGKLNWTKDYEHALVALRRSVDAGADLLLDLIGDGPDRSHLQFAVSDLGLSDRVRILGRRSPAEIANELRDADIFLHTSSSEGISNAVLEAMATGLPVVTTDAGGMREAVRDGIDGFVVSVRDADACATALSRLAADPELRERMGSSGRRRIQDQFRLDHQVAAFATLLREAAGR